MGKMLRHWWLLFYVNQIKLYIFTGTWASKFDHLWHRPHVPLPVISIYRHYLQYDTHMLTEFRVSVCRVNTEVWYIKLRVFLFLITKYSRIYSIFKSIEIQKFETFHRVFCREISLYYVYLDRVWWSPSVTIA